jgi:hypothetical protein
VTAGCSGSGSEAGSTSTTTPAEKKAVQAPKPQLLEVGDTVTISRRTLATTGFQISCLSNRQRANVEVVPGQRVPVGTVVSYPNGGPLVVVHAAPAGAYRVSCRKA